MRIVLVLLSVLFTLTFCLPGHAGPPSDRLRVGIFPFEPVNYIDSQGRAQGLYPDLLRKIFADQGQTLEFVPGTWGEGLNRLKSGEIDLITTIAYSAERAEVFDFNHEAVANIWGQVFLHPASDINTITDLAGRRVAITQQDINGRNFIETIAGFGIECSLVELPNHADVFAALQMHKVDAAVAPSPFGLRHAREYDLVPSSIQFSPFSIFFAVKKGTYPQVLALIDARLKAWKEDKGSYYYQRLNYWMGGASYEREIIPLWLKISLAGLGVAVLVFLLVSMAFRAQVQKVAGRLRLQERQYRRLVQSVNNIIMQVGTDGTIRFINNYGLELFGFSRDELIGNNVLETIIPPIESGGRDIRPIIRQALSHPGGHELVENENLCKDGRRVFIQWRNRPEYDASGRLVGTLSVGADISARRQTETELRAKEVKFRTLFEQVTDYALVLQPCDGALKIADLSESACQMHQYRREELVGKPIAFLLSSGEINLEEKERSSLDHGETLRFEVIHRRKDGTCFPVEMVVRQIEIDKEAYLFSIERDLTERKRFEAEKGELEKSLRQKFKMEAIGTLAGGIAHDFNNILAIILGSAELLRNKLAAADPNQAKVERILKAGGRAKQLVEQVLAFSRQQEKGLQPVRVVEQLAETIDLLRATLPRTVDLKVDLAADSQYFKVRADPVQLQQVLINLCGNAVFAMRGKGVIEIGLRAAPDELVKARAQGARSGKYLLLSVRDNGCGMPPEVIEKIFDPFFTTKEVGQGTGMGLAVVHGIVQSHQGLIHVESRSGEGSCFQILLPLTAEAVLEAGQDEEPLPTGRERILFVDDEKDLTLWAEEYLRQQGFRPTGVADSQAALELFSADPEAFDLLVTDQTMPTLSGLELIKKIREIRPDLPVILCSGYSNRMSDDGVASLQITSYLAKPYQGSQLVRNIRSSFDRGVSARSGAERVRPAQVHAR